MTELHPNEPWDPGFTGNRQVVVARLGPFRHVYARPEHYRKWFFHTLYDLPLEEWEIAVPHRILAGVCTISATLTIRFQPAVQYMSSHLDSLGDPYEHVRRQFRAVILDQAEQGLRALAQGDWLEDGTSSVEQAVEELIHVTLAVNNIHARCLCDIQINFLEQDSPPARATLKDAGFYARYQAMLRRRADQEMADLQERMARLDQQSRQHMALQEQQLALEREAHALAEALESGPLDELRARLAREEDLARITRDSEARRHSEQLRHEAEQHQSRQAAHRATAQHNMEALDRREAETRRELDLLFMEKQRLVLAEEIQRLRHGIQDNAPPPKQPATP